VKDYYITVSSENELSDNVEVYLTAQGPGCTPEAIQNKLQARIRIKPRVFIRDEEAIRGQVYSPKSRKPIRFIDRRRK
ncbi:MAG: phenylacetate--CoA ligase family protein, partial [Candidatus Omnitrophica bacterium]|nr:phenylacetate--CoA ligase family protein [Candidatus Omnitrophota bacterium]